MSDNPSIGLNEEQCIPCEYAAEITPKLIFMRIVGGIFFAIAACALLKLILSDLPRVMSLTGGDVHLLAQGIGVILRRLFEIGLGSLIGTGLITARRWGRTAYLFNIPNLILTTFIEVGALVDNPQAMSSSRISPKLVIAIVVGLYVPLIIYFMRKKVRQALMNTERRCSVNNRAVSQHIRRIAEEAVPEPASTITGNKRLALILGVAAFSVAYMKWRFGWESAIFLLIVLAFHEMGHAIAMRLVHVRLKGVFLLPIGAAVTGDDVGKTARDDVVISFGGVVFSLLVILASYGLFAATGWQPFYAFARLGAIINLFNLLPVLPLDGGRIMEAIIDVRKTRNIALIAVIQLAALAIMLFFGLYFFFVLLLFLFGAYIARIVKYQELARLLPAEKRWDELVATDAANIIEHYSKKSISEKHKIREMVRQQLLWRYCERLTASQKVGAMFSAIYAFQLYIVLALVVPALMKQ